MAKKILLVEDDSLTAYAEGSTLTTRGYSVVTAACGRDALDIFARDSTISLVLMDIDLGNGPDGPETALSILKIRDVPVIFLTGHTEKEYVDRAKMITNYGYVIKNSGAFVLSESIEMAEKLFDAKQEKKRQEEELRISGERYSAFYQFSPLPFQSLDSDGTIIDANPAWLATLGYARDEVIGHNFAEFLHPDYVPHFRKNFPEFKQRGFIHDVRFKLRHGDGTFRDVSFEGSVGKHPDGTFRQTYCIFKDITQQSRLESMLNENTEMFRQLFESMREGVAIYRTLDNGDDFEIVDLNRSGCALSRKSRDEIIGRRVTEVFPSIGDIGLLDVFRDVYRLGEPLLHPLVHYVDDNLEQWVENYVFRLPNGLLVAVYEDSTAEHLSDRLYKTIVQTNMDGYILINESGMIEDVNAAFCAMTSYSRDQLIGSSVTMLEVDDSAQYNRSQIFRLKAEGRNRFTRRYKRKDGSILYAEVSSTFLTGVQKGYVSLVRDVSETFIQYDRFKIILNSINSIIYIADMETYEILFINEYARQVIGGVEGKTCWKVLQKDMSGPCPFCTNKYLVDSDGNATDGYSYIHRNTRNNRWYSLFSMAIPWHGKRLVRLEIANDITDIKMSEEHLRASNLEKDYLLKELNHRIKNNLLMISSLIQLKDGGKNTTADLTDIRNQIDAIRIIHQKLYSVNDTLMVDIKEYVSELLDTLFDAFMEKPVFTVVESDISTMNTHDAISIGLIINEMATNSIKHAFPEVSAPEFLARFRLEHPDTVILTISNNGPPLPADISMENPETLGLRLITGLVQQLNGTITIQNDDRLRFIITFPL